MEIDYIVGEKTSEVTGISKYQNEIHKRMEGVQLNRIDYASKKIMIKNININLSQMYFYPLIVKKNIKKDNIKHITSQFLAYLLNYFNFEKSIVTCYDLISWSHEKDSSPLNQRGLRKATSGLRKASKIITISEFSKKDIINYIGYPEEKIEVVYPAVDHERFFRMNKDKLNNFKPASQDYHKILYVGSEQPRQNVPILIKALAKLKKKLPNVQLFKIGDPHYPGAREQLIKLISDLNLEKNVVFVGSVSEQELAKWYNSADLVVYPCQYAGFGLPPLESMACGTPVITSNTSSLPEVVGNAGITIDPLDFDIMATKMYEVLTNHDLSEDLVKKGIERSKLFDWKVSSHKTLKIYESMNEY